jgi:hypothetical protein
MQSGSYVCRVSAGLPSFLMLFIFFGRAVARAALFWFMPGLLEYRI